MSQAALYGVYLLLLGGFFVILATRYRKKRGLGSGETLSLDSVTLYSDRLKLVGRPDRMVWANGLIIPEEWRSSKRMSDRYRLQLGTYFLLIEEEYGVKPPHGFVVLGDGTRVEVENKEVLRTEVLETAAKIRKHRANLAGSIPVRKPAAMCRKCGQRENCSQASGLTLIGVG